jgi:pectinesterase inhibitor-like protein
MRPSRALWYAIVLLLLALPSSYASILEDTCKPFPNYDYCIKFFQSDKDSATADKRGLAVIAMRITRAAAVSILNRIAVLKAADTDKKIQGPLADCHAKYTGAVTALDLAAMDIVAGKLLQDAVSYLLGAQEVPESCDEGFSEVLVGVKSPLAAEGNEFAKECSVAAFVTRML